MRSDVRLKHLTRTSGRRNALLKFVGVRDRYAAPPSKVTLGKQKHALQDGQAEEQWDLDTLHIKGVRDRLVKPSG